MILSPQSIFGFFRRLRRSPRFPYLVFLLMVCIALGSQVFQYWWGVQIDRMLSNGYGSARRTPMFPTSWKTAKGKPWLEPIEPITAVYLMGRYDSPAVRGVSAASLEKLKWLPFLTELQTYDAIASNGWSSLGQLRQLKTLGLHAGQQANFSEIARLNRLENLTLTIRYADARAIAELARLPHLKRLCVRFEFSPPQEQSGAVNPAGQKWLQDLSASLAKLQSLERFESSTLTNSMLLELCRPLEDGYPAFCNVKELRLSESRLTNAGLANLHHLTNLVHLDISNSSVNDDGLSSLAAIPNLRTLYLAHCYQVTDQGAECLAEMTTLESLNLANSHVTPVGLCKLGPLKRLRKLRIDGHGGKIPEIRQAIAPGCKVAVQ